MDTMARIGKLYNSERRIIAIILLVLLLVGTMGYLAFQSLNSVLLASGQEEIPVRKTVLLKEIFNDISAAQNSVKSYSLTKDNLHFDEFFKVVSNLDAKSTQLQSLYATDSSEHVRLDTLFSLIERKCELMSQTLHLKDDTLITDVLKKITENTENKTKQVNVEFPPQRTNFLTRIFRKPTIKPVEVNNIDVLDKTLLQSAILKASNEQMRHIKEVRSRELELTRQDIFLTNRISEVIADLEKTETRRLSERAQSIKMQGRETIMTLAWFSFVVLLLLFLVIYVILQYVRKNKLVNQTLDEARQRAESLARAKENFLATMSHEIRTPMNAISGFSNLLLQEQQGVDYLVHAKIIKKASDHLLEIINNVLDYSKLASGKLELVDEVFSPSAEIEHVISIFKIAASEKKIHIHLVSGILPATLKGDSLRLRQVLINIIGNAVKFTNEGSVTLHVEHQSHDNTKEEMLFVVEDTGVGIEPNELPIIFNEFEQGTKTGAAFYGGTGLGLTISLKLIQSFGGNIDIQSVAGMGTKVKFNLFFNTCSSAETHMEPEPQFDGQLFKGFRFLIVDDEEYNRALLAAILEKWECIHLEAHDGQTALKHLQKEKFDVVLMDIRMHTMDGIEVTRLIRETLKLKIPVIAVTATHDEEKIIIDEEMGFNAILLKPFNESQLAELLCSVLPTQGGISRKLNMRSVEPTVTKHHKELLFSFDELLSISGGDQHFAKEMANRFLATASKTMAELKTSLDNKDVTNLSHLAHRLAAPVKHLKALEVYNQLREIEASSKEEMDNGKIALMIERLDYSMTKLVAQIELELKKL